MIFLLLLVAGLSFAGAPLDVLEVEPAPRSTAVSVHTPIVVHFDRPVFPPSVSAATLWAFGRWSGPVTGTLVFSNGNRTVTLNPDEPLSAGESVMAFVSEGVTAADGAPLRSGGYSFQFSTRSRPAPLLFAEIDSMTTRTSPGAPTQAYGGIASDLDGDRHLDLTIVNEISADLRVFLNRGDGSGLFHPFLQPTYPVGNRASPSEPADFNRDGRVDICVANINDNTVSILRGNGDGKFHPQQLVAVGAAPRGIAVLDVDGDGDVDIANTNSQSPLGSNVSLLLNNGSGVFGSPTSFSAGISGAWALASADMNEDGILDLIVGSRDAQQLAVLTGSGSGSFSPGSPQPAGGRVWMLVTGDVNADGHEDVATSNSFSSSGSILIGDGQGDLAAPQIYASDPFGLATDLGDLDGDEDLDWVTSSYDGDWRVHLNDGAGQFTLFEEYVPTQAASCSLMADLDGDADLDLALIDEIADEIVLMQNSGTALPLPPPGVPSGSGGTAPLRVGKADPGGGALVISWDASSCPDLADHHVLYGRGSQFPAVPGGVYGLAGARCGIGTSSPFRWHATPDPAADPSRLLWFVIVARDHAVTEGSWGRDSAGNERSGPGSNGASNLCNVTEKDLSNTCGQ